MKRPSEYMTMTDGVTQHDYKQALNKYIDYLEAENKQLILSGVSQQRELLAISCLKNIIDPIKHLRQLAESEGGKLDGGFAVHLTRQGMFYQELANKAMKEIDNCG